MSVLVNMGSFGSCARGAELVGGRECKGGQRESLWVKGTQQQLEGD